ncbi:MAG: ribosome small subunit-dependent GTPase A [Clostridia bacterium]|nr:ribosome small subunit-dependent GTPase A [Clostridia bacterium]
MIKTQGILIKGIGGFYYVETADGIYECKAKGINRRRGVTPLAGDIVTVTVNDEGYCSLDNVHERKNFLNRPPVANVDKLFILASTCEPLPSTLVIDKMTAIAQDKGIECAIVFTKEDLKDDDGLAEIYRKSGFETYCISSVNGKGVEDIKSAINGRICVFSGNSGVGKPTLLNALMPSLELETGEISDKLGRGKHTTRQVELFKVGSGYIADTPGFAAIDMTETKLLIRKENLAFCFKEFLPYLGTCKFSTCAHIADKGCKICEAVEAGEIMKSRHDSYVEMYNDVKDIKDWELK